MNVDPTAPELAAKGAVTDSRGSGSQSGRISEGNRAYRRGNPRVGSLRVVTRDLGAAVLASRAFGAIPLTGQ